MTLVLKHPGAEVIASCIVGGGCMVCATSILRSDLNGGFTTFVMGFMFGFAAADDLVGVDGAVAQPCPKHAAMMAEIAEEIEAVCAAKAPENFEEETTDGGGKS